MPKTSMNDMLKRRMTATQQASELQTSDEAYQQIFREKVPLEAVQFCDLPLDKLVAFFTADIGFRPYSKEKLEALAQQLQEDGLFIRIIVRPISGGLYEILSGHNRAAAAKLTGWSTIPAEVVDSAARAYHNRTWESIQSSAGCQKQEWPTKCRYGDLWR